MSFILLTDTCCNLDQETVDQFNIHMIPLTYLMDGEEHTSFIDGKATDFKAIYDELRAGKVITTSLAKEQDARAVISELADAGNDILYLGFSSALSGTFEVIERVINEAQKTHPDQMFHAVDTLCACGGQGLLIKLVARMRNAGANITECAEWAREHRFNIHHIVTVDDLKYLHRGGRLSRTSAILGSALNVKPLIHINDQGALAALDKIRTRKRAVEALLTRFENYAQTPFDEQVVMISHGDCECDANYLKDELEKRFGVTDCTITFVDPVIGAHTGPGVLTLFFTADQR